MPTFRQKPSVATWTSVQMPSPIFLERVEREKEIFQAAQDDWSSCLDYAIRMLKDRSLPWSGSLHQQTLDKISNLLDRAKYARTVEDVAVLRDSLDRHMNLVA
eukprot:2511953-Karenia_brevis.AAC.1